MKLSPKNQNMIADVNTRALLPWLLLTCMSGKAHALSCAQPKLDEAIITNSSAVFEGVAGNKHGLTWRQKTSVKKVRLTGRFAGVENLSVYDFKVTKNWKGVIAGQTVTILFNTTWGDNYVPGSNFLIVSPQQIGDMYWTPLCGNSIDLEWARKNGGRGGIEPPTRGFQFAMSNYMSLLINELPGRPMRHFAVPCTTDSRKTHALRSPLCDEQQAAKP